MGCNNSKAEDISDTREVERGTDAGAGGAGAAGAAGGAAGGASPDTPSRSAPLGIAVAEPRRPARPELAVGESYTDRREGEMDMLKRIVDTTASNLIDIHANVGEGHADDAARTAGLQRSVHESRVVDASLLEPLPVPSTLVSGVVADVLSEPVPKDTNALLRSSSASVHGALAAGLRVADCGPIVVSFGN